MDFVQWEDKKTQNNLILYLALSKQVRERQLKYGVRLLLERASFGDFGETMRGMHHTFEAVCKNSIAELSELCLNLASHTRPGTRLWSMEQLVRLSDERVIPYLIESLNGSARLCRYSLDLLDTLHFRLLHFRHEDRGEIIENALREYNNLQFQKAIMINKTLRSFRDNLGRSEFDY